MTKAAWGSNAIYFFVEEPTGGFNGRLAFIRTVLLWLDRLCVFCPVLICSLCCDAFCRWLQHAKAPPLAAPARVQRHRGRICNHVRVKGAQAEAIRI